MDQEHSSNGECQYDSEGNPMGKSETEEKFQSDKAGEYVRELLQEKTKIDNEKYPNATRLIDLGTKDYLLNFFIVVVHGC